MTEPKTWYFEQKTPFNTWMPCASTDEPSIKSESGTRRQIRNKHLIPEDFRFAALDELYDLFNPAASTAA